jgi:hypothetical protein
MTNDDLLQQLDKLIQKRLDAQDQKFQKRLEENNKQIRKEIRAEVDPLHERIDTQHKNLSSQISTVEKNLTGKIDQQTHDVADILAKAIMPDIDRHDAEIKELQKAVGLRPKH